MVLSIAACSGSDSGLGGEDNGDENVDTGSGDEGENGDETQTNNSGTHDADTDYTWDASSVVDITLNGTSVQESSDDVNVSDGVITISGAGNYRFSGTLSNGQILVNTDDGEIVRLILNGVDITNSSSAPIYIKSAEKVLIYLCENTSNKLTDGSSYDYDDAEDEEPNATIFSKENLTFAGSGSLTIDANFNDAINTKDGLIIVNGTYTIDAVDDGIRGKDYMLIKKGSFTINAGDDGIKSDNDKDETLGYIEIEDGKFTIEATGDAIKAETDLIITYGEFDITTSGDPNLSSAKGLKAGVAEIIEDGIFALDCTDDAIHSNGTVTINNGEYEISSDDDGIHSDGKLVIEGGIFDITKSYEGVESGEGNLTISGGTLHIKASDDGINLAGGGDGSGYHNDTGSDYSSDTYCVYISGGYIYINATGDGLDANGSVSMTGGTLLIDGPTSSGNSALDYDGSFYISGGTLLAAGSSGMAQATSSSSSQYSVSVTFSSTKSSSTLFNIQTSDGEEIVTYKPSKSYQSVVFSSSSLEKGASYSVYSGGSYSGDETDGLYSGGTYTSGTLYNSFTISSMVTSVGSSNNGNNPGGH